MLIIPAIDLRQGNCVRLMKGRIEEETLYSKDPVFVAKLWQTRGAERLHIADLDGAFNGVPGNLEITLRIREAVGMPIQLGGGIRDLQTVRKILKAGIEKVIIGTAAVHNPKLVKQAVDEFGPRVIVGIDVSDGNVAIAGWKEVTPLRFEALAEQMRGYGVQELMFTDTTRDGTLQGPNLEAYRSYARSAGVPTIVGGGVSKLEDVAAIAPLAKDGVSGIVIGKALYAETLTLEDAIRAARV